MCWKHEAVYGACFDYLFFHTPEAKHDDPMFDGSLFQILQDQYHVEIVNVAAFRVVIEKALDCAHEAGWIKPKNPKTIEVL